MYMFTTRHAQTLFRVASSQTIRNWAKEFSEYLSPTATPTSGTTRHFTIEDMRVFALISEYSKQSRSFEEMHAALKAGERGHSPTVSPDDVDTLIAGEVEKFLSTELEETRSLAHRLNEELDQIKSEVQPLRDENIRLRARIEDRDDRVEELNKQLKETQERVMKLAEEKGEAYVKGIMDAMMRRGDFPNTNKRDESSG